MERTSEGLEDQLVAVMLKNMVVTNEKATFAKWRKISSHLTTMGAPGFVNFRSLVRKLEAGLGSFSPSKNPYRTLPYCCTKYVNRCLSSTFCFADDVETGRFYLLWAIYQFVTVQTNIRCSELVPCLALVALLFPEPFPLPLPDLTSPFGVIRLGPAYTWSHLVRRARDEEVAVAWNTPLAFNRMLEFVFHATDKAIQALSPAIINTLEHAAVVNCFVNLPPVKDNQIRVSKMDVSLSASLPRSSRALCHVILWFQYADKMANSLLESMLDSSSPSTSLQSPSTTVMAPGNAPVFSALQPLPMDMLDILSCHVRMMLANNVQPCFTKMMLNSREAPVAVFFCKNKFTNLRKQN